jgi:hypothetical protein
VTAGVEQPVKLGSPLRAAAVLSRVGFLATRETLNKALCDFVQRGWITTDGKTTLTHHPHLLARRAS